MIHHVPAVTSSCGPFSTPTSRPSRVEHVARCLSVVILMRRSHHRIARRMTTEGTYDVPTRFIAIRTRDNVPQQMAQKTLEDRHDLEQRRWTRRTFIAAISTLSRSGSSGLAFSAIRAISCVASVNASLNATTCSGSWRALLMTVCDPSRSILFSFVGSRVDVKIEVDIYDG